jgi:hypothetical protein
MLAMKSALVGLALGLSVAALASPGLAKTREDRDSAREKAIHECSMRSGKISNTNQQILQFYDWRACMGEHGFMNE